MTFYAGIVFDCDGTLIDSEGIHQTVFDTVSRKHNLHNRDPQKHMGLSLNDLWDHIGGGKHASLTFEAWVKDVETCYAQKLGQVPLRPHILPTLQTLFTNNVPLACASNAQKKHVDLSLGECRIDHYFDAVLGREDVEYPKPHPEIYLKACQSLKLAPSQCLAVEDSPTGIQSAKAAGLTVIAFTHAYGRGLDLGLADFITQDIRQILDFMGYNTALNAMNTESRISAMAV